ncbi:hypothetical protein NBRC116594_27600 [Shimia sp. NS0008-38b]
MAVQNTLSDSKGYCIAGALGLIFCFWFWNRIISAAAEGMAPADAAQGKPAAFERAVFLQCFQRIS